MAAAVDLAAVQDLASAPAGGKRAARELRELTGTARADAKSFATHLAARSAVAGVGGAAALAAVSLGRPSDVLGAAASRRRCARRRPGSRPRPPSTGMRGATRNWTAC